MIDDFMKMANAASSQSVGMPSDWPAAFKDFIAKITNESTTLNEEEIALIRKKAAQHNVDEDEAVIFAKKIVAQNAREEKEDKEEDDDLPADMKKYQPVLENLEEENFPGAVIAFIKAEPAILLYLLIPVVCFFFSFWLGLLGILVALILIALKGYAVYKKLEKYI